MSREDDELARSVAVLELPRTDHGCEVKWLVSTAYGDVIRFHDRRQLEQLIYNERLTIVSHADLAALVRRRQEWIDLDALWRPMTDVQRTEINALRRLAIVQARLRNR
jgi:hypothetical protein